MWKLGGNPPPLKDRNLQARNMNAEKPTNTYLIYMLGPHTYIQMGVIIII